MFEICKILCGECDETIISTVNRMQNSNRRGKDVRLQKSPAKYDLWKYSFTNNVVGIWNSLPNYVVSCDNGNIYF